MTTTGAAATSTRPVGRVPALSKKDEAARSALIESFNHGDETAYARQDAELAAFDRAASARACRRIAAKLYWMILDDQDSEGTYYTKIAEYNALAAWFESQA